MSSLNRSNKGFTTRMWPRSFSKYKTGGHDLDDILHQRYNYLTNSSITQLYIFKLGGVKLGPWILLSWTHLLNTLNFWHQQKTLEMLTYIHLEKKRKGFVVVECHQNNYFISVKTLRNVPLTFYTVVDTCTVLWIEHTVFVHFLNKCHLQSWNSLVLLQNKKKLADLSLKKANCSLALKYSEHVI